MKRRFVIVMVGALALAACAKGADTGSGSATSGASPTQVGPPVVDVKLTEYAFLMPDTLPAGVTTLHVENVGGMHHFVEFQSVDGNHTDDDIQTILDDPKSQHAPPPKWLGHADIPNVGILAPGASTDITVDLEPGRYAAFCWMSAADGTPHGFLGMHKVFDVTGATGSAALPSTDFTVTVKDGTPTGIPDTIPVGAQTMGVQNDGPKPSTMMVAQVLVDEPIAQLKSDVGAWFKSGGTGTPPLKFLGGFMSVPPTSKVAATATIDFEPGVYVFIGANNAEPVMREVGGGGYPSASPSASTDASCTPDGTDLSIAVKDVRFDTGCLAAPADQPFAIMFDNQDEGTSHNLAIYPAAEGSKPLFTGDIVVGPNMTTYAVDGLPAGTYRFQCDVHPTTMTGTFVVK